MTSSALQQMEYGVAEKQLEAAKRAYEIQLPMDPVERERLILEHLPLVRLHRQTCSQPPPSSVLLDDLIHSGILGLIDAVNKFDPSKLVDLRVYAHAPDQRRHARQSAGSGLESPVAAEEGENPG